MAFLKFRGTSTSPTIPTSTTAADTPLSNAEIDGNFASLNGSKLELGAGNSQTYGFLLGDIIYANGANSLARLPRGNDGQVLILASGSPSWGNNPDTLQSISDDTSTDTLHYPSFVTATTGAQTAKVSSTKFTFNPSTGTLSSTNFNSLSDIRYKKDFELITDALSKVTQLTGYTYTLIESKQRSTGLTAQDVEKVLPEAVTDGDRKTLNYGATLGLIVEAIKELNVKVEDLKNQLANK